MKKEGKLISEPNYHKAKQFSENLLAIEMKKTKVKMIKTGYLGMSILDISKTLIYKVWSDCIKPKYEDRAKPGYTDTDSFIIHVITEGFLKTLLAMLKSGLIHLIMMKMIKDLFYKQKSIWFFQGSIRSEDYRRICCASSKNISIQNG